MNVLTQTVSVKRSQALRFRREENTTAVTTARMPGARTRASAIAGTPDAENEVCVMPPDHPAAATLFRDASGIGAAALSLALYRIAWSSFLEKDLISFRYLRQIPQFVTR